MDASLDDDGLDLAKLDETTDHDLATLEEQGF